MAPYSESKWHAWITGSVFGLIALLAAGTALPFTRGMMVAASFGLNIAVGLVSLALALSSTAYFSLKSSIGKVAACFSATIFLWVVADIVWRFIGEDLVSIADPLWFLGYLPLFIATGIGIKMIGTRQLVSLKGIAAASALTLALLLAYFHFFPLGYDPAIPIVENLVTIGYVLIDIPLIPLIVLLCMSIMSSELSRFTRGWALILAGILSSLAGDILFALDYQGYSGGSLIDILWWVCYLLWAYALWHLRKSSAEVIHDVMSAEEARPR